MSPLKFIHKQRLYKKKKRDPLGHWKNRWIQTPQRILMDPCIKQAPILSKRFWIIPWPLAYNRLELDCIRKIINFWYTFGWKWRVFLSIWDCRTHVHMTSMTSSVERTDLDFKISVALRGSYYDQTIASWWRKEAENLAPSSLVYHSVFHTLNPLLLWLMWRSQTQNNFKPNISSDELCLRSE